MVENRQRPDLKDMVGTLPDWAIIEAISTGYIGVSHLDDGWEQKVDPVSIDFHLGDKLLFPKTGMNHKFIDVREGVDETWYDKVILKPNAPFILQPDQFVITQTREHLTVPNDVVARLEGKSSLARIGLVVHLTAGRFDPGWSGNPVLEVKNGGHIPVILYQDWPICAYSFEKLMSPPEHSYSRKGRYTNSSQIHSRVDLDGGK